MSGEVLDCGLAGRCGGCPWAGRSLHDQRAERLGELGRLWRAVGLDLGVLERAVVHGVGLAGLRDRVDLGLVRGPEGAALGLRELGGRAVLDVQSCPMLSAELQSWVDDLRADLPPVSLASLRLRVGPQGQRGLWLDMANTEIKALLDEGAWLARRLAAGAVVELGQRHRAVVSAQGQVRLGEPQLHPWFQTWVGEDERPAPLYSAVASFSQPGFACNRALVRRVRAAVRAAAVPSWVEIGCGSGNLTLPLAAEVEQVLALDVDALALAGLARGLAASGLEDRVRVERASLASPHLPWLEGASGALLDPPRSGLGPAVGALLQRRPQAIVYVSCHGPSMVEDLGRLAAGGYAVVSLEGVDQFPHTPHGEWVMRLSLG